MSGYRHPPGLRAKVIAALQRGESVPDVASAHGLTSQQVHVIKHRLSLGTKAPKPVAVVQIPAAPPCGATRVGLPEAERERIATAYGATMVPDTVLLVPRGVSSYTVGQVEVPISGTTPATRKRQDQFAAWRAEGLSLPEIIAAWHARTGQTVRAQCVHNDLGAARRRKA